MPAVIRQNSVKTRISPSGKRTGGRHAFHSAFRQQEHDLSRRVSKRGANQIALRGQPAETLTIGSMETSSLDALNAQLGADDGPVLNGMLNGGGRHNSLASFAVCKTPVCEAAMRVRS